jgi:HAD superfamily hydrolase (TIGR01484 family)
VRPVAELAFETRRSLRGLFCDIDDTLTTDGHLSAEAYGALERLQRAQLLVIPVTGRPAGWCDHIARMWPVDGIVGENGAFYFRYDRARRRMHRRFADPDETRALYRSRLESIAAEILRSVPGAAVASDQRYRETDLAIDFCEDVPRLPDNEVERIAQIMRGHGLTAKVSSIHVNGWFGRYDKLTMTRTFMMEAFGVDLDTERTRFAFVGDSPNDEPMFEYFPHAIGVANLRDFGTRLEREPAYISTARSGAGFREIADFILSARSELLP